MNETLDPMNVTANDPRMLNLGDYQADFRTREDNMRKGRPDRYDSCFMCGRGMTERAVETGWNVHLHVYGLLIPVDMDVDEDAGSQGWFPVGSECAKRIPRTHRIKR